MKKQKKFEKWLNARLKSVQEVLRSQQRLKKALDKWGGKFTQPSS